MCFRVVLLILGIGIKFVYRFEFCEMQIGNEIIYCLDSFNYCYYLLFVVVFIFVVEWFVYCYILVNGYCVDDQSRRQDGK